MTENPFRRIGVVGAGTMGSGIALTALLAGMEVVLQDPFPEALYQAQKYLEKFLERKEMTDRMDHVILTGTLFDLEHCEVVIEAALEELDVKTEIFRQLEEICAPGAILATNTSTLSVTQIASAVQRQDRIAGMHFFNPAPVLPLVEVVRGQHTSDDALGQVLRLAKDLGKTPVVTADTPGFIVNRVARPFYGEALRLLGEGTAPVADIDLALRLGGGFKMGPFQLIDLIGVDVNAMAMQSLYEQSYGEPRYRPHPIQMRQKNSGDLGRKTGKGFYDYRSGSPGIREDQPPDIGGGQGQVLFYSGLWSCGSTARLSEAGYRTVAFPEALENLRAVFVTETYSPDLCFELERVDDLLPADVPVFVQCLDATLEAHLPPGRAQNRTIGLDTLFFKDGGIATLTAREDLSPTVRDNADKLVRTLGKVPLWVDDTPGMILPRVVGMLVNEAVFAVQDQVADAGTIDRAMQLGVNYPQGLIAWGRALGWLRLLRVLEHLHREYGEARYRPCQLIRRWAREESRRQGEDEKQTDFRRS